MVTAAILFLRVLRAGELERYGGVATPTIGGYCVKRLACIDKLCVPFYRSCVGVVCAEVSVADQRGW